MTARGRTIAWMLAVVALTIAGLCIALLMIDSETSVSLPVPNGYDDFVAAGARLAVDPSGFKEKSLPELQALVASNGPALDLLRAGLQKESRVPLQYTLMDTTNWANELPQFKSLAQALCAEARSELLAGNPDRAAEICLETVQFGVECSRGGVLIHRLVGVAIENIGFQALDPVLQQLDAENCRRVVKRLDDIWSSREPLSEVTANERAWSRMTAGIRDHFAALVMTRSLRPFNALGAPAIARCEQQEASLDQQLLKMAARAYEMENGHPPESAPDLVPDYLQAVPTNPTTGKPLELQ